MNGADPGESGPTGTPARILDATLVVLGRAGITRLALEDVAAEAGVSRQTVYRHFGSRDGLLAAVIVREEEVMLAVVFEAASGVDALESAVTVAVSAALHATAAHPLLQRLLRTEPEALLPYLTLGSGPVLSIVGPAIAEIVARRAPGVDVDALEYLSDAIGRLVVSYAISPREDVEATASLLGTIVAAYVGALEADARSAGAGGP